MKFFEGDVKNAISKRGSFCSAFIVFVENKDPESLQFRQVLDEEDTIPVKDYVAFRISPSSQSYKFFRAIYEEVPVPSLVIIGADGRPIRTLSSCFPKEDFYASIREALDIHKAESGSSRLPDRQSAQILLKLPLGETAVVEFPQNSVLGEVKAFVRESLQVRGPFQMINPFPRKIFSTDDDLRSLVDLQLTPTSTILVVPVEKRPMWLPTVFRNVSAMLYLYIGRLFSTVREWFCSLLPRPH